MNKTNTHTKSGVNKSPYFNSRHSEPSLLHFNTNINTMPSDESNIAVQQWIDDFDRRKSFTFNQKLRDSRLSIQSSGCDSIDETEQDIFSPFPLPPTTFTLKKSKVQPSFSRKKENLIPLELRRSVSHNIQSSLRSSDPMVLDNDFNQQIISSLKDYQVHLIGVEDRLDYCDYVFHVDIGHGEWKLLRKRFSDFYVVRKKLSQQVGMKAHCGKGVCKHIETVLRLKFPNRQLFGRRADIGLANDRMMRLFAFIESWLKLYRVASRRDVRCCASRNCSVLTDLLNFLELPPITMMQDEVINTTTSSSVTSWRPYRSLHST